ncbi:MULTISPECIES: WbqC family protein [Niastella]|uniref:WbqC family protein n=1 Tax=Niastella soli TaxID=2821487 RepID=A0ABS3YQM4_9BACT|nr:WbqC family protein [Niastella soli]MBO9200139.1 WbqC family protein [Niastella soli]
MKLAIMQPYIFPYLGYFQLISAVDKFVIYDDVNFITRGWINRNNILVNGKPWLFTIPLKDASQNRLINEIELIENSGWENKFLKTVEQSYKKAPFFKDVFSLVSDVILSKTSHIGRLATLSIKSTADYIGISTTFIDSSLVYNNAQLKAQNRILDICKLENAHHYINPIGGVEIYSRELFEQEGIKINFIKTASHSYNQYNNEFTPYLSIIDVLMFNSKPQVIDFLTKYELI